MSFFNSVIDNTNENLDKELENQEQENLTGNISPFTMPEEARRVLVYLYKQNAILNSQTPHLFTTLCRYEKSIRQHLAEVYLQLVLDEKFGVAFVKIKENDEYQENENDEESVSLMSKRLLSIYDTLILLMLRKHYREREECGEKKIIIDIERLDAYLSPFLPLVDHSSKDRKKLIAKIKDLQKRKLLATVRGSEDRFEITPVLRHIISGEMLDAMVGEYLKLLNDPKATLSQHIDEQGVENE
ncbi:DUF4194 domain-containing protein [Ursidibacter arcticus]